MKKILTLTLCLLYISLMSGQTYLNPTEIDSIFSEWSQPNTPGASIGIYKDGRLLYGKGYGYANLDYDVPNSSQSVFRIASTSKQFTAACIIHLAQQGKLQLTDHLRDFFPEFPPYGDTITVKHLLNHTSGLRDYLTVSWLKGLRDKDYYTDDELMSWLVRQKSINFSPGDEMVYSNSGYWLLGQIVKKVAGKNMREYAEENIFAPLGMQHTHFHNNAAEIVKKRATGYYPSNDGYVEARTTLEMIGDGGIFTTVEDMLHWDKAYYDHKVLDHPFWNMMTDRGVLNNGDTLKYAAGLFLENYKGVPMISHGGAFVGYRAEYIRFPEQHLGIVVFCNRGDANPTRMAQEIADILLKDVLVDQAPESSGSDIIRASTEKTAPVKVKGFLMENIVGRYQLDQGLVFNMTENGDSIQVHQLWNDNIYNIYRKQGNTFEVPEGVLQFEFMDLKDSLTQMCKIYKGASTYEARRKEEINVSKIDLKAFVGKYYSDELDAHYHVTLDENSLQLAVEQGPAISLNFETLETLSNHMGLLSFKKEGDSMSGFLLDAGRAKNMWFQKVK